MQAKLRLPVAILAFITIFASCKKEGTGSENPFEEVTTHSEDQFNVSAEMDAVANDANVALESNAYFNGRVQQTNSICGATAVADTVSNPKTITITYNGNNCANTHHRSGNIVLSMAAGTRWKQAGAVLTVNFQNLKIKRLSDNKSITISGTQTLTNVSGGLLVHLANLQQIIHTISSSNMSITFDDNSQRTWSVSRKRVYTYNNGVVLTVMGNGTNGSITNAAEWGNNRFGKPFTTSITTPLVFRQDCSFRLTAGELKHEGFATSTVKFGLNANGVATTCPGTGNYYFLLTWTGPNGNTQTFIRPY